VSRLPILIAFEQLLLQGYVVGRVGAGTFVSASIGDRRDVSSLDARSSGTERRNPEHDRTAFERLMVGAPGGALRVHPHKHYANYPPKTVRGLARIRRIFDFVPAIGLTASLGVAAGRLRSLEVTGEPAKRRSIASSRVSHRIGNDGPPVPRTAAGHSGMCRIAGELRQGADIAQIGRHADGTPIQWGSPGSLLIRSAGSARL
jgi:hypothetical protein